jgi:hypothetical protein
MQYAAEDDAWQVDPLTARVRPAPILEDPVLIVIESAPTLSRAIAETCDFLRITVLPVDEPRHLIDLLGSIRPIAVLLEADGADYNVYDLMMVVAGYDPGLPVMLVVHEADRQHGAIEAAARLWQLDDVVTQPRRPGILALIDFLFHAGRRYGRGRFMPL